MCKFGLKSIGFWVGSLLWSALNASVRALQGLGWIVPKKLPVRVVSVGNIQAGGTGKTPVVAFIAQAAVARGMRVCILTRGYGGTWEKRGGVIAPASDTLPRVSECGDEALLLHDLVPQAWIGVGRDRKLPKGDFDLVLLDDGFQNYKIKKDLEIVLLTSKGRWDALFRDFEGVIKKADLLVWTKGNVRPKTCEISPVRVQFQLEIGTGHEGKKNWLVSGVGEGVSVQERLEEAGVKVNRHFNFKDHAVYTSAEVQGILSEARRADATIFLTGKDWVKWREFGVLQDDVHVIEPKVVIEEGEETWNRALWGE